MIKKSFIHKTLAACLMFAVWSVSSMVALAASAQSAGELTVSGSVTVDGRAAVSNSTVASGSTISTAENSSATINVGKAGRVELMPNTTLMVKFDDTGIYGTLNGGKVRVMSMSGYAANVSTREGMAFADSSQANTFAVEKE